MTQFDVVIPAGGTIDASYVALMGSPCRALAPLGIDKEPILQQVVNALRDSGIIRRVIVVAPDAVQQVISGVDLWLPAGPSGAENIQAGLAEANPDAPVLVCASDLPLITAESVSDFLAHCQPEAQIAAGLVSEADYNKAFPDAPPSQFVQLADTGPVTMSGLFLVHPKLLIQQSARFDSMFAARKDQWRMASLLGPRLLWGWATHTLSLRTVTARAETLLSAPVQIITNVSPLLAYDIDTADDYTYANRRFK